MGKARSENGLAETKVYKIYACNALASLNRCYKDVKVLAIATVLDPWFKDFINYNA